MLTNFEKYTEDLTLKEKEEAGKLIPGFKNHVGKKNAISNREIRLKMKELGIKISDPKMRKYVSYLRICYLPHLCASQDGYYLAENKAELKEYLESLWQRISQQHAAYEAGFNHLPNMS